MMKWLVRFLFPGAYDQGHQDGFKEGYNVGQGWGHDHGACEHSHPYAGALGALERKGQPPLRGGKGD